MPCFKATRGMPTTRTCGSTGRGGIGFGGVYHGNLAPDAWHRIAFVVDASSGTSANNSVRKFIDGTLVGVNTGISQDGTYGLDPTALLFTDNDGETTVGYVNSIQILDTILSDSYIALWVGRLRRASRSFRNRLPGCSWARACSCWPGAFCVEPNRRL